MFAEAEAYERFMGRWSRRLAAEFVEFAGVEERENVLDVGCGTGSLAGAVLERSPTVRLMGIDPSAKLIAFARSRHGLRARFEQGDAQHLGLADGMFDAALSLLALNFVPDRDAALREMIRVTHAGGVVAAAVWDYGDGMEMLRVFWDAAVALDAAAGAKDERRMPLCRAGELAAMWRAHGLVDVDEHPLTIATEFSSFADFWLPFLSGQGPAGAYGAALSNRPRHQLEQRLRRRLLGGQVDGPIELRARAWAVRGVVPPRAGDPRVQAIEK